MIDIQKIKDKVKCPQLGYNHYGEWGALTLEQRKEIHKLCELCEDYQERIVSLERKLMELKNELKTQDKIWQPKEGERFWLITGDSFVINTTDCLILNEKHYIETGNYFKTQEEAEKQAEYNRVMNRFRKYVEAYSEPLDWDDKCTFKYFVYFDNEDKRIYFDSRIINPHAFQIYASSEEILKDAIVYSAGSEEEFIRIVFGGKNGNNSDSTSCS